MRESATHNLTRSPRYHIFDVLRLGQRAIATHAAVDLVRRNCDRGVGLLKSFLASGADVDACAASGSSSNGGGGASSPRVALKGDIMRRYPLLLAALVHRNAEAADVLLEHGADTAPLVRWAFLGIDNVLTPSAVGGLLVKHSKSLSVTADDGSGWTLLHHLCRQGGAAAHAVVVALFDEVRAVPGLLAAHLKVATGQHADTALSVALRCEGVRGGLTRVDLIPFTFCANPAHNFDLLTPPQIFLNNSKGGKSFTGDSAAAGARETAAASAAAAVAAAADAERGFDDDGDGDDVATPLGGGGVGGGGGGGGHFGSVKQMRACDSVRLTRVKLGGASALQVVVPNAAALGRKRGSLFQAAIALSPRTSRGGGGGTGEVGDHLTGGSPVSMAALILAEAEAAQASGCINAASTDGDTPLVLALRGGLLDEVR